MPTLFTILSLIATNHHHIIPSTDPGTSLPFASCPDNAAEDVDAAIQSSHTASTSYKKLNPRARAQLLMSWHQLILQHRDDIAKILTHETGKPLAESHAEIDYATGFTWWFSGEADRIQGSVFIPSAPNRRTFVIKQPLGVAVALVPWNFPIAMVLRKAGAALAAGCAMLVKPSPETPLTCLTLAHLASQAGFAPGVLNVLTTSLANTPPLSEALCKHPLVQKVSFTGSTRVGKIIATHCAASGPKKVTLELGGNCPFIVFEDADLEHALAQLMPLKWRHAGQACIAANRIYVQASVYERFAEMLKQETAALVLGHGMDARTTMGPLTTERGIVKAERQVRDAVELGAKVILGTGNAKIQDDGGKTGYFFDPTILTGMKPQMLISREETFAPVAALYKFETDEEAIAMANETSMGLASYAFTKNVDRMWYVAVTVRAKGRIIHNLQMVLTMIRRCLENLEAGMIGMVSEASLQVISLPFDNQNPSSRTLATPLQQNHHLAVSKSLAMARRAGKTLQWLSTWSLRRGLSPSRDNIDG
jgi:succinate-semialdehyde dehydrogenase / glutarate-semialdehyde dehydrogenase